WHARERVAQSVAPIPALPPWFAILRRSALEAAWPRDDWETPEFFLLDAAASAAAPRALFRIGGAEDLSIDSAFWARDVLAASAALLAGDYSRFRERHPREAELVPPQLRVEQIGEMTDVP